MNELRAISMNVMGIDVCPRTALALGSHCSVEVAFRLPPREQSS